MNNKMLFDSICGAAKALLSGWSYKAIFAAILSVLMHKHAVLFYAFSLLVFVDCFTKWIAISHQYLQEQGNEKPTFWQAFIGIKAARSAGEIKSDVMKHRFLGKICVYLLCVIAAACADLIMVQIAKPTWAVATIIGYLTITELLSIIENLNAAGVQAMDKLLEKIRGKL